MFKRLVNYYVKRPIYKPKEFVVVDKETNRILFRGDRLQCQGFVFGYDPILRPFVYIEPGRNWK